MVVALAATGLCLALKPVAEEMNQHVESALEVGDLRTEQMQKVKTLDH
jgi:hypothetical protein